MALEVADWNIADSLQDAESVFYFLEAVLDGEDDAAYEQHALATVAAVRGGWEALSLETGVAVDELTGKVDRKTLVRVMEAFRPASDAAKVA